MHRTIKTVQTVTRALALAAAPVLTLILTPTLARAQTAPSPSPIDTVVPFLSGSLATANGDISGFTYDPATDTVYTTSFGADATLRKIQNPTALNPVITDLISTPQFQAYYTSGESDLSNINPLAFALQLNPKPIVRNGVTIPAGHAAVVIDSSVLTQFLGTPNQTRRNELSKRVYTFNLQQIPDGANVNNYLSTVITKADVGNAIGLANANTVTTNDAPGRQFAFSSDGQSIYYVDSQVTFGGIYRVDLRTNAVSRLLNASSSGGTRISSEPAVRQVAPGIDRLYFGGSTDHGNVGGVSYADYDGASLSAVTTLVSGAALSAFLNTTATLTIGSISSDDAGNLYLDVTGGSTTGGTRRGATLRLDPQGRLSKVATANERSAFLGVRASIGAARHQVRTVTFAGPEGSFPVTQVLFVEGTTQGVSGLYAFLPGDFNRDNALDQDDIAFLRSSNALAPRGQTTTNPSLFKFDMNGDSYFGSGTTPITAVIDYRDVKVLQSFYPFENGDANIDLAVNWTDLDTLRDHYLGSARTWFTGDLTGDDTVNAADLSLLASTWDLPLPTYDELSARYTGDFLTATATAFNVVPEPTTLSLLALAGTTLLRRRPRR